MLITKVKVSKVTNLSEARYCAGMGVDLLSFPASSVDPKTYQEITGWVAGPLFGIEVDKGNLDVIEQFNSDFIQVNAGLIDQVAADKKLIVSMEATNWQKEKASLLSAKARILFLELAISSLDSTNESIINEACKDFQVLVKSSSVLNLDSILKLPVAGISLDGVAEERPGLKEYPLSEVLEKLEAN